MSLGYYEVPNYKFHFPSGSGMGIYAALALPLTDLPNIDVFLAFFLEAFYSLPFNETSYEYPPLVSRRSFTRKSFYQSLESKLDARGYPGKMCLLRSICEASMHTVQHSSGVLGDLLHLVLTPSASIDPDQDYFADYEKAELDGLDKQDCSDYNDCPVSILDLMGFVQ
ncbi:uncharacterized protein LOC132706642 [Cylas formicarius]|uniref:uncharacterized protein LOC132706642 n=1 Tax=Cylas formicarius TaxID=197179 RepID=UPI002958C519|nr:uncharacterized protein LOC132706642 [Cylas formicarius]